MPGDLARSTCLLVFLFSGCGRDAPTEPKSLPLAPRVAPTAVTSGSLVAPDEVAGLAVAIEDVRTRILPTLGEGAAVQRLASALAEVERGLPPAEDGTTDSVTGQQQTAAVLRLQGDPASMLELQAPLALADGAAAELGDEASLSPELDVVRLVLERLHAIARGRANPTRTAQACAASERLSAAEQTATPCTSDMQAPARERREQ